MAADSTALLHHALDFTFFDLPSTASIRIDIPVGAGAMIPMSLAAPVVQLGASYGGGEMTMSGLSITPRRLEFALDNAPASLPLLIHILSKSPFVHGWLQVPESVQVSIATSAQRIRFVGPGYWVVPLTQIEGGETSPTRASQAVKPVSQASEPPPEPVAAPSTSSKQKLSPTSDFKSSTPASAT